MNRKLKNSLLVSLSVMTIALTGVACAKSAEKGPEYNFTYNPPLRAETDAFMSIDGRLDEPVWENQNYLYWVGGKANEIKATTVFTSKGLYVGVRAVDNNLKWVNRYAFNENSRFKIQVVQEDEINYNDNRNNIHPTKQFWFDIDAKNSLSRMERRYDAASYYEGELNGQTEYLSAELFLPWSEMGYTDDELNQVGIPNGVKLLIQYLSPNGYSGFPGFSDDNRFSSYYTYDKNGSTCYADRYSQTDTLGYSVNGWTPGDKWVVDEETKTATNTVDRTQILWFRKDINGDMKSTGTHYIASAKVKAIKKVDKYPHVGIMTLSSKTIFNIYGVSTDALTNGTVGVSAAQETDGGQWVATKKFNYTYAKNYVGAPEGNDMLPDGLTLAKDEVYLTVAKRGGELYYFVNGEYIGMEYDERVSGECVVGIFANGQTVISDWSFEDYSDKTLEMDEYLNKFLWFINGKDNGAGYVVIDKLVAKHNEEVSIRLTPKPGYILTGLTFNEDGVDSDKLNLFLTEANDNAILTYTPKGNLSVNAVFKKLASEGMKDIFFAVTEEGKSEYLTNYSYTIRGNDKRFIYTGEANNRGYITGSLLQAGSYDLLGDSVTIDGNYTIEIIANGYVTKSFGFNLADLSEVDKKNPVPNKIFELEGYPYGDVSVNGTIVPTSNYALYTYTDPTANEFISLVKGVGKAYMKNGVYSGNFLFDGSVSLVGDALDSPDAPGDNWKRGAVVGYVFSVGQYFLEMKTTAWENGNLCLNYNGVAEISLKNFPTSTGNFNQNGSSWNIKVARYNDVIYVYNCKGELGFTLSRKGLDLVNSSISSGANVIDTLNEGLKKFFDTGSQTAIGMYRMQSVEGGGVYQYSFTHTNDNDALSTQFSTVDITLKQGETYTLSVESNYRVGDGYLKDTNVKTIFSNLPDKNTNYTLVMRFENGTMNRILGTFDKQKRIFTAVFPLVDNAEVWLEEYDFGAVTVNGTETPDIKGIMLTKNDDGTYGNSFYQGGSISQYYINKVSKGNYLLDVTVTVAEQNPTHGGDGWAYGSGVGISLSSGNTSLSIFTNAWEVNRLLIKFGSAMVYVDNFPRDNNLRVVGSQFNFKILRYNDVYYFYNCNNELVFHVTNMAIIGDSGTISGTAVSQDLVRQEFEKIIAAGDENAFGIYREYVPNANGAYNWAVDLSMGDEIADNYTATISLKTGEPYTMHVTEALKLGNDYQKGPVTLQFTNIPTPKEASGYLLVVDYGSDNLLYIIGEYDKINAKYTASFTLTDDAEVYLEEYDFGQVSVNGETIGGGTFNRRFVLEADGSYSDKISNNSTIAHYYSNMVTDGDYYVDAKITTIETNFEVNTDNVWYSGGGFGIRISSGKNNWITFFANAWEKGMFVQTDSGNTVRVYGAFPMDSMLHKGDVFRFFVIRRDNVLYVYNNQGTLVFHIDQNGIAVDNENCSFTHTGDNNASLNAVNKDISEFFAAGRENAIALARLIGPANAYAQYNWDVEFKAETVSAPVITDFDYNGKTNTYSTTTAGAKMEMGSTTGDWMARVKLNSVAAASSNVELRIQISETKYIILRSGVDSIGQEGIFFRTPNCFPNAAGGTQDRWWSETFVGYNTSKFVNEDDCTAEGSDGYLDLMIVRSGGTIYFYGCEYLDAEGKAVDYASWQLIFAFKSDMNVEFGADISYKDAGGSTNGVNGHFTGPASEVAAATAHTFILVQSVGKPEGNVVINDDDAAVAAFMAGNKLLSDYPKI